MKMILLMTLLEICFSRRNAYILNSMCECVFIERFR